MTYKGTIIDSLYVLSGSKNDFVVFVVVLLLKRLSERVNEQTSVSTCLSFVFGYGGDLCRHVLKIACQD